MAKKKKKKKKKKIKNHKKHNLGKNSNPLTLKVSSPKINQINSLYI